MRANTLMEPKSRPEAADLRELAGLEGTCVSIYLAGHKAGSGSRPMPVRLRAMIGETESLLAQRGVLPTDRELLLEPIRARAADAEMSGGHGDGLVMFRTSRRFEQLRLPWEVDDLLVVEGRPLLVPLAKGLQTHPEFFILAVSKQNSRLLECGPNSQRLMELPAGTPRNLVDFQGFDRPDHTRGQTSGGVNFGFETFSEKEPNHLHDFCRALDRALQPVFEQKHLPVVLAGATAELVAYRSVNRYSMLAPVSIEGSPDGGWTDAELAGKGRAALRGWHPAETEHALDLYLRAGTGKKSVEIQEILREAAAGRVLHLFMTGETDQMGDVDRVLGRVLPAGAAYGAQERMANAAAFETWRHGGQVWFVDEPLDRSAIAAVYRW